MEKEPKGLEEYQHPDPNKLVNRGDGRRGFLFGGILYITLIDPDKPNRFIMSRESVTEEESYAQDLT